MPHISKKILSKEFVKKLEKELGRSLERASANSKFDRVFGEFFTKTEKIMFAKRLAVISMFKKGVSRHMISQSLGMSPSTIERMSLKYEQGKYNNILNYAVGKKDIWKIIEDILTLNNIMPPRFGKGRWSRINQHISKRKVKES